MRRYADLPLDYADATIVVAAEDLATPHVLTLERKDFAALRWHGRRSFQPKP